MSRSVFDVFIGAMVCYARWFFLSVLPGAHTNAPLGFRRLGLVLLFPVLLTLQLVHWVAFLVDELCFPDYRRVSVKEPVFIITTVDQFSMPSGHTSGAFLFVTLLALHFGPVAAPLYAWSAVVGVSRVALGVHFPSDTVLGAALGTSLGLLASLYLT